MLVNCKGVSPLQFTPVRGGLDGFIIWLRKANRFRVAPSSPLGQQTTQRNCDLLLYTKTADFNMGFCWCIWRRQALRSSILFFKPQTAKAFLKHMWTILLVNERVSGNAKSRVHVCVPNPCVGLKKFNLDTRSLISCQLLWASSGRRLSCVLDFLPRRDLQLLEKHL